MIALLKKYNYFYFNSLKLTDIIALKKKIKKSNTHHKVAI